MDYTKNYHLPQWAETDRIMMEDFNQMCVDMEAGLDAVKSAAESAVTAVEENRSNMNDKMAAVEERLAAAMGTGGKTCRITYGSYSGNGTYGVENPVTLQFDFYPVLILVASPSCIYNSVAWPAPFFRGVNVGRCCYGSYAGTKGVIVEWGDSSVSYYSDSFAGEQNNQEGITYFYIALGYTS